MVKCWIFWPPSSLIVYWGWFPSPHAEFEVVDGHKGPPFSHPLLPISECFPREITLFDIIYLTHRRSISLPLVSLVWSVLIYFITSVSSLSFHQNVDQCNSFNLLCLLSDKFQCFAKGYRKRWLGYWTLTNVK